MAAMMQRITMLENTLRSQAREMDQKVEKNTSRRLATLTEIHQTDWNLTLFCFFNPFIWRRKSFLFWRSSWSLEKSQVSVHDRLRPVQDGGVFLHESDSLTTVCPCLDMESEILSSKDLKKKCQLMQNKLQKMEVRLTETLRYHGIHIP